MPFAWGGEPGLLVLYPAIVVLIAGAAEFGNWIGRRSRKPRARGAGAADIGTLTGAGLGLLALLLAFSFSIAVARYDARRDMVLQEANAIGSTANFALMLPEVSQGAILKSLRDYAALRLTLGATPDPAKMDADIARSQQLQTELWRGAVAASAAAPQSLAVARFVNSLNEMNNIHESRLTNLRYHVPLVVTFMLLGVAMVAMGFTGYNSGVMGARRRVPDLIMSITVAVLIMLVVDLDDPVGGVIRVPVQPLVDAAAGIRP